MSRLVEDDTHYKWLVQKREIRADNGSQDTDNPELLPCSRFEVRFLLKKAIDREKKEYKAEKIAPVDLNRNKEIEAMAQNPEKKYANKARAEYE